MIYLGRLAAGKKGGKKKMLGRKMTKKVSFACFRVLWQVGSPQDLHEVFCKSDDKHNSNSELGAP